MESEVSRKKSGSEFQTIGQAGVSDLPIVVTQLRPDLFEPTTSLSQVPYCSTFRLLAHLGSPGQRAVAVCCCI